MFLKQSITTFAALKKLKKSKTMKTIKTIVCIGTLLFGMHFSYAQLKVTSSGGVKIGSQPQMSGIPLS